MEKYTQLFQELKRKMALTYPSFAQEISTTNISVDSRVQTAGTEGKNILFNPQFLDSLTDKQQLFVVAHEFFHIKFKHMFRLKDKDGNLRDMQLWNIATDAIINENLKDDGLEMVEGGVEMKNARKFTAEELYEKLLKERERKNKKKLININLPLQNKNGNNKKQQNQNGENQQINENSQQKNQNGNNHSQQNQGGSNQQGNNNSQHNNNHQDNSGSSNNSQPNNANPQQNNNQQSGNSSNNNQHNGNDNSQQNQGANNQNGGQSDNDSNDNGHSNGSNSSSNNQQNGNQNSSNSNQQQNNNNDGNYQQNNGNQQNNNNNSQDENDNAQGERSYTGDVLDDHSLWQKAFEDGNSEKDSENNKKNSNSSKKQGKDESNSDKDNTNKQNPNNDGEDNSDESESKQNNDGDIDEQEEFEKNRELRRDIARNFAEQLKNKGMSQGGIDRSVKDIGLEKEVVDWKQLLRREIDKTETLWTQRRSIAENNYAYRLEENDIDDEALTEVMLDTSGSVSTTLLRNFVRQLKPLLKKTKLKVGCFDMNFYGFTEIKNEKDIDKFRVVGGGGTNFEGAIQNFTFKREVNKIVFTDGYDEMTMTDKKYADIIWIVFDCKDFKPAVGRVIQVSHQDLKKLYKTSPKNNSYYEDDEYSF